MSRNVRGCEPCPATHNTTGKSGFRHTASSRTPYRVAHQDGSDSSAGACNQVLRHLHVWTDKRQSVSWRRHRHITINILTLYRCNPFRVFYVTVLQVTVFVGRTRGLVYVRAFLRTRKRDPSCKEWQKKVDTTPRCSRVVPHPSTKRAQHILSSEFGRDRLYYV
jgi:hypothetical protein